MRKAEVHLIHRPGGADPIATDHDWSVFEHMVAEADLGQTQKQAAESVKPHGATELTNLATTAFDRPAVAAIRPSSLGGTPPPQLQWPI